MEAYYCSASICCAWKLFDLQKLREIGFKTFNLFEKGHNKIDFGAELTHTVSDGFNNNRIFFGLSGTFN